MVILQLFFEAVVVGLIVTKITLVIACLIGFKELVNVKAALLLFFSGAIAHLLFEAMGVNRLYCSRGYACNR